MSSLAWQRRLCGYILKKIHQAAAWNASKSGMKKMPRGEGVGIYAARLMEVLPFLPVEEEGRL